MTKRQFKKALFSLLFIPDAKWKKVNKSISKTIWNHFFTKVQFHYHCGFLFTTQATKLFLFIQPNWLKRRLKFSKCSQFLIKSLKIYNAGRNYHMDVRPWSHAQWNQANILLVKKFGSSAIMQKYNVILDFPIFTDFGTFPSYWFFKKSSPSKELNSSANLLHIASLTRYYLCILNINVLRISKTWKRCIFTYVYCPEYIFFKGICQSFI